MCRRNGAAGPGVDALPQRADPFAVPACHLVYVCQCVASPANEGAACDDNTTCTVASVCTAGACGDPLKPGYVLNEDFSGP